MTILPFSATFLFLLFLVPHLALQLSCRLNVASFDPNALRHLKHT